MKTFLLFTAAVFVFISCSNETENKTKMDSVIPVKTKPVSDSTLLNYTDANGLRQGHWIISGRMIQDAQYAPDSKVEEGMYVNGKKEGDWKTYDAKGNMKSIAHFVNDQQTAN